MKKKILSLLLALCFVMALVPMTAFAKGTSVDNWDGTADTSWYTDHKTDTEYHFTTAEQLAGLAQLVNDKTASVSFEEKRFTWIMTSTYPAPSGLPLEMAVTM